MSLLPPFIGTSDWHLWDGGPADDSDHGAGVWWTFSTALTLYRPAAVIGLGDLVDRALGPLSTILRVYGPLLRRIDHLLVDHDVPFIITPGNHEQMRVAELLRELRLAMPLCALSGFDGHQVIGGWRCSHGEEWDPWCHGPLYPVAHLATGFAGLLERVIPGFDESFINPTRIFSPARAKSVALQMRIEEAADGFARKWAGKPQDELPKGEQPFRGIVYAHTHRPRITDDRLVVNTGCNNHGHAEFAAFWPDGLAVIHQR
jgi:hypothetical protein